MSLAYIAPPSVAMLLANSVVEFSKDIELCIQRMAPPSIAKLLAKCVVEFPLKAMIVL